MAKFTGTSGADTIVRSSDLEGAEIFGFRGNDFLEGSDFNDLILGGKGDDTIRGQLGEDTLFGGQGDDIINGGFGNDIINGDKGNDLIRVGGDDDTIQFTILGQAGNEQFYDGADTVFRFEAGGDSLELVGNNADYFALTYVQNGDDLEWYYKDNLMVTLLDNTFTGDYGDYFDFFDMIVL